MTQTTVKGYMLEQALRHAVNAHAGQFDKGGQPYILHCLKVMHYLKNDDEELQAIAVLHDTLEDTDTTVETLTEIGCSQRVIDGVVALTKKKGQTYDQYKQQVFASEDAMRVKMCDLRHNSDIRRLKGVTQKDIDRVAKYQLFYTEILQRLQGVL